MKRTRESRRERTFQTHPRMEALERRTLLTGILTYDGQTLSYIGGVGVQNRVVLSTGPGAGNYLIQDTADTIARGAGMNLLNWSISADGHTATGSETGISNIYVDTQDTLDIVSVQATDLPVKIQPSTSVNEQVRIGGEGAPFGAQLITAPIFFDAQFARQTSIIVDDAGDAAHRDVTVSDSGIFGLTPSSITFTHATMGSPLDLVSMDITLMGGTGGNATIVSEAPDFPWNDNIFLYANGNDGVFVQQLASTSQVIAEEMASGSIDNVQLGGGGSLRGVSGDVSVNGGAGLATLLLNGSVDSNPFNATIGIDNLGNGTIGSGSATPIRFVPGSLKSLSIQGGTGGNTFNFDLPSGTPTGFTTFLQTGSGNDTTNIFSNPLGADLQVEGNAGSDQVNIGQSGSAEAAAIQGQIEISNQSGRDAVAIDGSGITAPRVVTVNDSAVAGLTPAALSLSNLSSLSVTGGTGTEAFNVTPSATVPIRVDGGPFAPLLAPPDTLNVDITGATAPVLSLQIAVAGQQGSYLFADRQPVNFTRVGSVAPALATISGMVFSAQTAAALVGSTVFLDENGNGVPDAGEPVSTTDGSGKFQFTSLAAGTYSVDLAPGVDLRTGDAPNVTIAAGQSISGVKIAAIPAPSVGGPDLSASVQVQPASSAIGGSNGKLKMSINNAGPATFSGPVQIALFASGDGALHPADTAFATITTSTLKLKKGAWKTLLLPFTFPSSLPDGNYFILASTDSSNAVAESNEANNVAVSPQSVAIRAPFVDLSGGFAKTPRSLKAGNPLSIPLTIENLGNIAATGTIDVDLFASSDQTLDASDQTLITHMELNISVKPGKTKTVSLHVPRGTTVAGDAFLIANINSTQSLIESSYENNNVLSEGAIVIV